MIRFLLSLALLLGSAWGVLGQERSPLWPDIPKATGKPHPEGNAYWRRNHMRLMKHDRDLTMRSGDRTIGASLKACFECHSTKASDGAYVTYQDEAHFCRSCHDYAAVKVDCFTCHRSTPDSPGEGAIPASMQREGKNTDEAGDAILSILEEAAGNEEEQ